MSSSEKRQSRKTAKPKKRARVAKRKNPVPRGTDAPLSPLASSIFLDFVIGGMMGVMSGALRRGQLGFVSAADFQAPAEIEAKRKADIAELDRMMEKS